MSVRPSSTLSLLTRAVWSQPPPGQPLVLLCCAPGKGRLLPGALHGANIYSPALLPGYFSPDPHSASDDISKVCHETLGRGNSTIVTNSDDSRYHRISTTGRGDGMRKPLSARRLHGRFRFPHVRGLHFFLNIYLFVCVHTHAHLHACHCTCMEVRGQFTGAGSLLPLYGPWGSNSGIRLGSKPLYPLSQLAGPW